MSLTTIICFCSCFVSMTSTFFATGIGRKFAPLFYPHLLFSLGFSFPPSPNFNVAWFWTAMSAGIFRTKVRTTKHTFFTTLKWGGRGVRYLQLRFRACRYMFLFRVPSWVVRTFVRHLSDSQMFVVCRSASKRCSLVSSASKTFVALDEKWHVLPSGEGGGHLRDL